MAIPLRQTIRVGAYVVAQHLKGVRRYPLVLMLEPLFRCNLACAGCGKIDYPDADPQSAPQRRRMPRGGRRMRRADRRHRRRRAAAAPRDRRDRRGHHRPQEIRLSVHQRAAARKEDRPVQAQPLLRLDRPSRRRPRGSRPLGLPDRRLRPRRRGDQAGEGARLPRQHQLPPCSTPPIRSASPGFFDDVTEIGIDGITVSPGYAYERAPDQEHFLNRRRTKELFRDIFRRDRAAALVIQPIEPVPRFPRRQPDLPLHALGQSDAQLFRLAAALLSARRRLCQDLQGADGGDRLGRLRHRQLREMRRLHGA